MTTTSSPSILIAVAEPVFANAERLALAGFLAGYTGLTREAYTLVCASTPAGAGSIMSACSMPAARTSSASRGTGTQGPGSGHSDAAAVHDRRVLPVRG